jgi:hypothetical protein
MLESNADVVEVANSCLLLSYFFFRSLLLFSLQHHQLTPVVSFITINQTQRQISFTSNKLSSVCIHSPSKIVFPEPVPLLSVAFKMHALAISAGIALLVSSVIAAGLEKKTVSEAGELSQCNVFNRFWANATQLFRP